MSQIQICSKTNILLISFLLILLINSSNSTILIKAGNEISFNCERNIYYIMIDVIFSDKPQEEQYPFTLKLSTPDNLYFKCMLDYSKSNINCFHSFSNEEDYIEENELLQFPYPFPELEDIEWDYETFLQKIYRKVWNAKTECGNEDLLIRN